MGTVDLTQPGWRVQRGQAIWQAKAGAPELAGTLLLASREDGEDFIRFSKEPLDIVMARRCPEGWRLDIGGAQKRFGGRGAPPSRIGWFQLADAVFRHRWGSGWSWHETDSGRWRLANPRTGEQLEGFFRE
jgi:hypothetical protein